MRASLSVPNVNPPELSVGYAARPVYDEDRIGATHLRATGHPRARRQKAGRFRARIKWRPCSGLGTAASGPRWADGLHTMMPNPSGGKGQPKTAAKPAAAPAAAGGPHATKPRAQAPAAAAANLVTPGARELAVADAAPPGRAAACAAVQMIAVQGPDFGAFLSWPSAAPPPTLPDPTDAMPRSRSPSLIAASNPSVV